MVAACLLLVVVSLTLAARRTAGGSRPRSIRLTPHHALHAVEIDGARVWVGTGPGAAPTLLGPWPLPAAAGDGARDSHAAAERGP